MKPMPLTWNLDQLKEWGDKSGIPFQATPQAKNTVAYDGRADCHALRHLRYLPHRRALFAGFHFQAAAGAEENHAARQTLIRKLVLDDAKPTVVAAHGVECSGRRGGVSRENLRGRVRIHLEFAPAAAFRQFAISPTALANRSGQVGKYMNGHAFIQAFIEIDQDILPGMNPQYGLISRQFFRCSPKDPYVRHDLRIWEAARERAAR